MIVVVYGSRTKIQVSLDNKTSKSLFMASGQYGCLIASEWQEGSKSLDWNVDMRTLRIR
jgi:hypothetical protein